MKRLLTTLSFAMMCWTTWLFVMDIHQHKYVWASFYFFYIFLNIYNLYRLHYKTQLQ